jgi:hypothetical protein
VEVAANDCHTAGEPFRFVLDPRDALGTGIVLR